MGQLAPSYHVGFRFRWVCLHGATTNPAITPALSPTFVIHIQKPV